MTRTILCSILTIPLFCAAQPAVDNNCSTTDFYALSGNTIHLMQMNGATVTDMGAITSATAGTINSLAIGDDITAGSSNRTFYTSTSSGLSPCFIMRYTGTAWDTITSDSLVYHQAGAYGPFIYFQRSSSTSPNDQKISRLNANGTLSTIFSDTSLRFTVADIAVDVQGNIYCFRGPQIGNTTELTVISPTGSIINSYSTTLNNLSALYGSMFYNDTLFLGWGTTNGEIFPVIFSGSTATLGAGRAVPAGSSYKDLANCYIPENQTGVQSEPALPALQVYPNPASDHLIINNVLKHTLTARLYSSDGRMLEAITVSDGQYRLNTGHLPVGLYILVAEGDETMALKFLKE